MLLIFGVMMLLGSVSLNLMLLAMLASRVDVHFSKSTMRPGEESQTVAVYDISGGIYAETVKKFNRFHDEIKLDRNVKAVVLRINSGGGGLSESDQIHRMVRELKHVRKKKVVVSMGGVAASGAYYISAPADQIIAERTTLTGSIGVIATWLVLEGTLEKIGIEPIVVKSTNARGWKDEMSPFRQPGDREIAHVRGILDESQTHFENVVREGRKGKLKTRQRTYNIPASQGSKEMVSHSETEPFNGKIYLAQEAMSLGLIDGIGYESDAIRLAAELAGLDRPNVVRYSHRKGLLTRMIEGRTKPLLSLDVKALHELQTPRILLLWRVP